MSTTRKAFGPGVKPEPTVLTALSEVSKVSGRVDQVEKIRPYATTQAYLELYLSTVMQQPASSLQNLYGSLFGYVPYDGVMFAMRYPTVERAIFLRAPHGLRWIDYQSGIWPKGHSSYNSPGGKRISWYLNRIENHQHLMTPEERQVLVRSSYCALEFYSHESVDPLKPADIVTAGGLVFPFSAMLCPLNQ